RFGQVVADADVHHVLAGLKGGELLELGSVVLEFAIEVVREEIEVAVVVDESTVDAAVIEVADAIEGRRIRHRKRAQKNGVDEGEDRYIRADAERNCQHDRGGESGSLGELAEGGFDVRHSHWNGRAEQSTESRYGWENWQVPSSGNLWVGMGAFWIA